MSNNTLYIIGNGFDIFHGIKSKYSDFNKYVKEKNKDLYLAIEDYLNPDELWSDFEESLAYIDTDKIVEEASDLLVPYSSDDWSDASHHDYQYEVNEIINALTVKMKEIFTKWILSLHIPKKKKLKLSKSALYLTFNYTDTLERIYKINPSNITYIHNKAIDEKSTLILGHSRKPTNNKSFNLRYDEDVEDVRITEANQILDRYFKRTYKNTDTIIEESLSFFYSLNSVKEIFVLGHSISPVDIKYFEVIRKNIQTNAIWNVSYYDENLKDELKKSLINIGIEVDNIKMIELITMV